MARTKVTVPARKPSPPREPPRRTTTVKTARAATETSESEKPSKTDQPSTASSRPKKTFVTKSHGAIKKPVERSRKHHKHEQQLTKKLRDLEESLERHEEPRKVQPRPRKNKSLECHEESDEPDESAESEESDDSDHAKQPSRGRKSLKHPQATDSTESLRRPREEKQRRRESDKAQRAHRASGRVRGREAPNEDEAAASSRVKATDGPTPDRRTPAAVEIFNEEGLLLHGLPTWYRAEDIEALPELENLQFFWFEFRAPKRSSETRTVAAIVSGTIANFEATLWVGKYPAEGRSKSPGAELDDEG